MNTKVQCEKCKVNDSHTLVKNCFNVSKDAGCKGKQGSTFVDIFRLDLTKFVLNLTNTKLLFLKIRVITFTNTT